MTGSATRSTLTRTRQQLDEDHDRFVVAQHMSPAVDERETLTACVDHRAEVRARAAHLVGDTRLAHDAVD